MTKAVMITGTHSGVGKTTISLGLMAALTRRGLSVAPYKVGPDYIDTSHHSAISNKPSRNLDTYIMGIEGVRKTFMKGQSSDISIIEGVMGLYDGMEATEIASSAHVAKTLGVPVVLIINVHGMSRSAAAVVKGYQMLDPDVNIKGLILNMVGSPRHRQLVEDGLKSAGLDIPVIGSFPSNEGIVRYTAVSSINPISSVDSSSIPRRSFFADFIQCVPESLSVKSYGIDFHLNNCTALSVKILDNVPCVRLTRIFLSGLVQLII